jgi:uncharacterized iron-regulated membrane protein
MPSPTVPLPNERLSAGAAGRLRRWAWLHTSSSLVCSLFLLLLCLTGLPLIFHHEIEHLLGNEVEAPAMPAGTPLASLDKLVVVAKQRHPAQVVQMVYPDADDPNLVTVLLGPTPQDMDNTHSVVLDARTAQVLAQPSSREGLMYVLRKLHVDLFAGLPGRLFLGFMGLLFITAIVSGVVLYRPFMRKLDFGTVRTEKARRIRWLDLHNLLGIVTVTWALVVGITGVINTLSDLVIEYWQSDQMAEMLKPYEGQAPLELTQLGSVQTALLAAQQAIPDMKWSAVAFPGSTFASAHHYAVFMKGNTPITKRLLKPALVDAQTGQLTDSRDMPWYVTALLLSQPLHFGDYGGMPLKIIWALLDVMTIFVLGSGLYLWWARRKRHVRIEDEIAELSEARVS